MRRSRIEPGEGRAVFRHEPNARRVEPLDDHACQHAVELGSDDPARRGIEQSKLIAAAPRLSMFLHPAHEKRKGDAETVQTRAHRLQANAVGLAVASEIECARAEIPRCRRVSRLAGGAPQRRERSNYGRDRR